MSGAAVKVLLFAGARQAAGTSGFEVRADTVADVLDQARTRFGSPFGEILERCRVWVNGDPVPVDAPLRDGDEVAVLPPVSGGAV